MCVIMRDGGVPCFNWEDNYLLRNFKLKKVNYTAVDFIHFVISFRKWNILNIKTISVFIFPPRFRNMHFISISASKIHCPVCKIGHSRISPNWTPPPFQNYDNKVLDGNSKLHDQNVDRFKHIFSQKVPPIFAYAIMDHHWFTDVGQSSGGMSDTDSRRRTQVKSRTIRTPFVHLSSHTSSSSSRDTS